MRLSKTNQQRLAASWNRVLSGEVEVAPEPPTPPSQKLYVRRPSLVKKLQHKLFGAQWVVIEDFDGEQKIKRVFYDDDPRYPLVLYADEIVWLRRDGGVLCSSGRVSRWLPYLGDVAPCQ